MDKAFVLCLVVVAIGCGKDDAIDPTNNDDCVGAKCDRPNDDPNYDTLEACQDRRNDVLKSGRDVFLSDAIRWSCADVEGVTTNNLDDRGQEYCEYFAIVKPPPEQDGGEYGEPITLGRVLSEERGDVTPLTLELTDEQIFFLEDHIDEVAASCVFTTWHNDVDLPIPACETECPAIQDVPVDAEVYQMKSAFNGNSAANDLIKDCINPVLESTYVTGDVSDDEDLFNDDFIRGCSIADTIGFGWRKSDSSICAASMRLAECGCTDSDAIADAVLKPEASGEAPRGFPIGGWQGNSDLPSGCRYVELGDESQTIVECDLTGGDVINSATDLKGLCRSKYADSVVVYVPIPGEAISCEPQDSAYADTCSEQPWVITE